MTENYYNFQDFIDLKSPDSPLFEDDFNRTNTFHPSRENYEHLMNIEDSQISKNLPHPLHSSFFTSLNESSQVDSENSTSRSNHLASDSQLSERELSTASESKTSYKWSQNPSIQSKKITKQYEPIFDGKRTYRYEDNPEEYKKARKRIQNRESACRVRARQKSHVVEVEQDVYLLKKENEDLKLKNAALTAENNLLKHQIAFLERIVTKNQSNSSNIKEYDDNEFVLPLYKAQEDGMNIDNIEEPNHSPVGIMRLSRDQGLKRHSTIFGVLAVSLLVLCVFTGTSNVGAETGTMLSSESFTKPAAMVLLSINDHERKVDPNETLSIYAKQMERSLSQFLENHRWSFSLQIFKILSVSLCLVYFGYVCLTAKRVLSRKKPKYY